MSSLPPPNKPNRPTSIVVLTGAGISEESGIPTFRGVDGLWNGYRIEEVASPQAFRSDPELVQAFYNMRRKALLSSDVKPNPAHHALSKLEAAFGPSHFLLVTQNVDDLHERVGSKQVLHIHGELLKARCTVTGEVFPWRDDLGPETIHPKHPELRGTLRPHIVWFGESPLRLPEVYSRLRQCDLFIAVGTSGHVYPAAGFVQETSKSCRCVEINREETPISPNFEECLRGPASQVVPDLVEKLINGSF